MLLLLILFTQHIFGYINTSSKKLQSFDLLAMVIFICFVINHEKEMVIYILLMALINLINESYVRLFFL